MPRKKQSLVRAYSDVTDGLLTIIPDFEHYATQKRIFSKFDDNLRTVENHIAIIIQENLFLVKANNALVTKRLQLPSYTVFVFWCKRGLVCRCLKPFTPNRKYGAEFPERSENRFR